jgi:hypothetical protein
MFKNQSTFEFHTWVPNQNKAYYYDYGIDIFEFHAKLKKEKFWSF